MTVEAEGPIPEFQDQPWGSAPWLFRVAMEEGESLSSLFCRQARLNEMTLNEVLRVLGWFGGTPGRIDLDIQPDGRVMRAASLAFGIPVEDLRTGTLEAILKVIVSSTVGASNLGHNWQSRHLTWVLPKSWLYGMTLVGRSRGGIPYCPICFAESQDPWFPIEHRISLVLTCERHGVWLRDDCPRCGNPVGPMTLIPAGNWSECERGPLCKYCERGNQGTLKPEQRGSRVEYATRLQIDFQRMIRAALRGEVIQLRGIPPLTAAQFLGGLSFIKTVTNHLSRQGLVPPHLEDCLFAANQAEAKRHSKQPSLEFMTIADRRLRMEWFQWVCERPLDRWHVMRKCVKDLRHITRTKSHPWEGVAPDGEFLKSWTWQFERQQLTQDARLNEVKVFFQTTQFLELNDREVRDLLGGGISTRECLIWRNIPSRRVPAECRARMSHFMRIWDSVVECLGNEADAKTLLIRGNHHSLLNGMSPVRLLLGDRTGAAFEQISAWVESGSQFPLRNPEP